MKKTSKCVAYYRW